MGQPPGHPLPQEVAGCKMLGRPLHGRQHRGNVLVAPQAQDLLGEVLGDGQVMPPGGGHDAEPIARRRHDATQPGQRLLGGREGHGLTRHPGEQGQAQLHRRRRCGHRARGPGADQLRLAPGLEARHQQVAGHASHGGIRPPAEAVRGVGVQAVAAGRGPHHLRFEPGALQEYAAGGLGHLGAVAAHDARQGDGAGFVGDDEVALRERPGHAVQGRQGLPGLRPAHGDGTADGVGIEGVGRVPVAQQQLVGGIHRRQPLGTGLQGPQEGLDRLGGDPLAQLQHGRGVDGAGLGLQPHRDQRLALRDSSSGDGC